MNEDTLKKVVSEIIEIALDDGVSFHFERIVPIREEDEYNNFRVSLEARFGRIRIPMRIDMTTGDAITPREIDYQYRSIFGEEKIIIKAYTLETILAEKYETILRRNVLSSIFRCCIFAVLDQLNYQCIIVVVETNRRVIP
jgi:hypothetical protein